MGKFQDDGAVYDPIYELPGGQYPVRLRLLRRGVMRYDDDNIPCSLGLRAWLRSLRSELN